jgi:hypothetical protein
VKSFFGKRLRTALFAAFGLTVALGGPEPITTTPILAEFSSNGCSVFPDGATFGCCYVHDLAYFTGGTAAARRSADRELYQCVADVSSPVVGGVMYLGVTLFGLPGVPTRVRWGYGWGETRQTSYAALSPAEQSLVDAEKQRLCRGLTHSPGTDGYLVEGKHRLRAGDARRLCPGE